VTLTGLREGLGGAAGFGQALQFGEHAAGAPNTQQLSTAPDSKEPSVASGKLIETF